MNEATKKSLELLQRDFLNGHVDSHKIVSHVSDKTTETSEEISVNVVVGNWIENWKITIVTTKQKGFSEGHPSITAKYSHKWEKPNRAS